ncbi:MAG: hypothetical protein EOR51_11975 [Mesorhizobium sp.]|uniref:hypothetical protein n=1 Tax=Mesorhizobium sp. TaxID=1871066 RepID=UPI000FE89FC9|nr:hypothetical protein [Mesorhizobium sp.]RWK79623.1 MAG: hypothetical protein EOR50_05705 [Mesorhizobium sp.]RWK82398.1 MAG: hypothetical protein EOR51_11975 [Mesorhizobium sp.]RWL08783.1 MAG: hypothetical protein EOR55_03575 [Mesorhizobium sp.]
MTAPSNSLDDLQSDIGNLHQLLEVLYDQTGEQEFQRDGKRIALADQIHALAMIARDLAERANEALEACHLKVLAERKEAQK